MVCVVRRPRARASATPSRAPSAKGTRVVAFRRPPEKLNFLACEDCLERRHAALLQAKYLKVALTGHLRILNRAHADDPVCFGRRLARSRAWAGAPLARPPRARRSPPTPRPALRGCRIGPSAKWASPRTTGRSTGWARSSWERPRTTERCDIFFFRASRHSPLFVSRDDSPFDAPRARVPSGVIVTRDRQP